MSTEYEDDFYGEALELLEESEEALLNIESADDIKGNFDLIYRNLHSLKGTSGMMGYSKLQEYSHMLEDAFEKFRDKQDKLPSNIDFFLKGIDNAKAILEGKDVEIELAVNDEKKQLPFPLVLISKLSETLSFIADSYEHDFYTDLNMVDSYKRECLYIMDEKTYFAQENKELLKSIKGHIAVVKENQESELVEAFAIAADSKNEEVENVMKLFKKVIVSEKLFNETFSLLMFQYADLEKHLLSQDKGELVISIKKQINRILIDKKKLQGN